MIEVSEVFGPTVQGEGPSAGRLAGFVRFGRCDLHCRWCDTPYTWDWKGRNGTRFEPAKELHPMAVEEVVERIEAMNVGLVVITGGEPLLQQRALIELVDALVLTGVASVEVETNGRHAPAVELSEVLADCSGHYNVSPKLANSGQSENLTISRKVISTFLLTGMARFKWVVMDPADVDRVAELSARFGIPASATWVMPEGQTPGEVQVRLPRVAEAAIGYGFNVTGRLHLDIWGGRRGH